MNNITIDEVKDILKCSIDETTNMNEAIERTLQHIYLKGWNDAEKEHNYHFKKIRAEINGIEINGQIDEHTLFVRGAEEVKNMVLEIIDKYRTVKGTNE